MGLSVSERLTLSHAVKQRTNAPLIINGAKVFFRSPSNFGAPLKNRRRMPAKTAGHTYFFIFLFYLFVLSKPGRLAGKARPSGFFVLSFIGRSDNFNFYKLPAKAKNI